MTMGSTDDDGATLTTMGNTGNDGQHWKRWAALMMGAILMISGTCNDGAALTTMGSTGDGPH